jgi:cyclin-dependent kinase regulatory subunit CKS1
LILPTLIFPLERQNIAFFTFVVLLQQRIQYLATMSASRIEYSEKYADDQNEYRHVILPKELSKTLPKSRLLTETEWRQIGVQQSRGWTHYAIHRPEPHILLFRRPLGTDPQSGRVDPELERIAREEYKGQFGILRK